MADLKSVIVGNNDPIKATAFLAKGRYYLSVNSGAYYYAKICPDTCEILLSLYTFSDL